MAKSNPTPEERLLQIIDNPGLAKERPLSRLRQTTAKLTSVAAWLDVLKIPHEGGKPLVTVRMINQLLAVVCGIMTIVWGLVFLNERNVYVERLQTLERSAMVSAPGEGQVRADLTVDLGKTLRQAKKRNMFTFLPPKIEVPVDATPADLATDERVKDLKLVGVLWSAQPQAIIEQVKDGRTHLVSKGDRVGAFVVKRIEPNKVIISLEGKKQEWELQ